MTMMMRRLTMLSAGWLCLAAALPAIVAVPAVAAKPDLPNGFRMKGHGTLVHIASRAQFPLKVGGFARTAERGLDAAGKDFAVAYRETIDGNPVIARIAMVQILQMTPQEHYLGMKGIIGSYFQDLTFTNIAPAGEGPYELPGMAPGSAYQGRFSATDQAGVAYELSLTTVKLGDWDVRLTAAYPAATAKQAQADILALVGKLRQHGPAHI